MFRLPPLASPGEATETLIRGRPATYRVAGRPELYLARQQFLAVERRLAEAFFQRQLDGRNMGGIIAGG